MKRKLLSLIWFALVLPMAASAQNPSNLILFTENGEKFTASVNGEKKNDTPATQVRIEGLKGDFHKLLIEFDDTNKGTVSQNFMLDPGTEQKAQISMKKNGKWVVRPFGDPTPIKSTPAKRSESTVSVNQEFEEERADPNTETVISTTTTTTDGTGESIDMRIGVGGESVGVAVRVDDGMTERSTTTTTTVRETRSVTHSEAAPAGVIVDDCSPMAGGDFEDALVSLRSKTFSDSRMTQAKQIVNANCMSADQIKTVMGTFEYEDDKLEFAKMAHDKCADPENYWKVNDAFEFEMTIDELNEYIESK